MPRGYDYDLIVIGAGIAGMVSAVTASGLGKRVAVIEKARVGGNCTNTTCIPSKALIRLGHAGRDLARLGRLGLLDGASGRLDSRKIMAHIGGIVRTAYEKDRPETFEQIGIRMVAAPATFLDRHRVQAGDRVLSARAFVIAAGTTPFIPYIPGLAGVDYVTNETLYRLDDLPRSLLILGGGVDGLEYASAFGRLGVETTVVEMATRLLPAVDGEVTGHLLRLLEAEGIRLVTGARAAGVRQGQGGVSLQIEREGGASEEIEAERLLVALGRKPDLEGLGLEKAGVQVGDRGIVTDRRLRTSAPNIYACGDVTGPYQLASTAEAQAIVASTNAVLPVKRSVDYRNNVYVIFTEPPLACLGLTEEQARREHGRRLRVYRFPYATMRRALIDGHPEGMAKFLCDGRGRVVGAHILGEAAPEVIHEVQIIRAIKKPLHALSELTHAYPTYAQALVGRASQLAFLDRMEGNRLLRVALNAIPGYAARLHLARERLAETHEAPSAEVPASFPAGCSVDCRTAGDGTRVVEIRGTLGAACEQELSRAFAEGIGKAKRILLNLSGLVHMDTVGAGLLVVNAVRANREGAGVAACGLSAPLRDVFRLTRLDEAMALFACEEQALGVPFVPAGGEHYAAPPERSTQPGWARSAGPLSTGYIPDEAMNINVHGRETAGPVRGFGRLWDKRYRLRLEGPPREPREIVALWRAEFPGFWPEGNRFFSAGGAPIVPGTVAVLNLALPGGLVVATGLRVIYADADSFAFMSTQGHIISGWITFSSFREGGAAIVQVHPLFRASDPLMEAGFHLGAARQEDEFWHRTLGNLARRLGARGEVEQIDTLADPRVRWEEAGNFWLSAAIRSSFYMPFYWLRKALRP